MRKIRYGIVGLGHQGKMHIQSIQYRIPDGEIRACCSIVPEEVDYATKTYDIPYGYLDFEEMLRRDDLDAILIASSASAHYEQIVAALNAGYHVWTEKPLAVELRQCQEIYRLAQERPAQIVQLGFNRRFDKHHMEAKRLIDAGAIGEPIIVKCNHLDPISNRDFLVKYARSSGSIFVGMCVHDFDISRYFLGAEAKRIFASGGVFVIDELKKLNQLDNACVSVQFEGGKIALIHTGRTNPAFQVDMQVIGTEGSIMVSSVPEKNQVMLFDRNGMHKEGVANYLERFDEAFFEEIRAFHKCLVDGTKPVVGVVDGLRAFEMSLAAEKSFATGQAVTL